MKGFFFLFSVFVELFAQYVRGLAAAYHKLGKKLRGFWCWLPYMVYILVFASLSAIGVFMAEVNLNEQTINHAVTVSEDKKEDLKRANADLDFYRAERDKESKTGRGGRFRELEAKISELTDRRDRLETEIESVKPEQLESKIKAPANWVKILMFAAAVMMIYIGLIITPWEIELESATKSELETIPNTPEPAPPVKVIKKYYLRPPKNKPETKQNIVSMPVSPIIVPKIPACETVNIIPKIETIPDSKVETIETIDETIQETVKKGEKVCPVCGTKFIPKPSKKEYCCSNCRLTAYRKRVAEESNG